MTPQIKTILYASDLGDHMRPVFRQAIAFASSFNAKIIMLHVVEPLGSTGEAVLSLYLSQEEIDRIEQDNLASVVETMKQRVKRFCDEECQDDTIDQSLIGEKLVRTGRAGDVIASTAEEVGADLIVVGSHSSEGTLHDLIGSAARRVTQVSRIPVLVVPNRS